MNPSHDLCNRADKIRHIDGMLPMRSDPLDRGYPHVQTGIKQLIEAGTTRPRTCQ